MRKRVILWVEDSPADALLLRLALHQNAVDVELIVVPSVAEARRYLRGEALKNGATLRPDLVLVDLNLPMDGGQSLLGEASRSAPTVVFTTTDDPRQHARCIELGAAECITKPEDWLGYDDVVQRLCRYFPDACSQPPSLSLHTIGG
jgi:CheY-like chemotaxis protein